MHIRLLMLASSPLYSYGSLVYILLLFYYTDYSWSFPYYLVDYLMFFTYGLNILLVISYEVCFSIFAIAIV